MPDVRILLLSEGANEALTRVLGKPGRALTRIEDPAKLVEAAADADVVVLDVVPGSRTMAELCRDLRGTVSVAEIPILAITGSDEVEERIGLLEAGADDVMVRPVDERELDARVEALDLRHRRTVELRPSTVVTPSTRRPGRRLITVFSPKGGVGTTTVSVNLALAIAAREPDAVALVDLTPMGSSVATYLDLQAKLNLADLLRDSQGMISPEILRATYLTRDRRHLLVLAGSATPAATAELKGDEVTRILDAVLAAVPTVVVDAGSHLDERSTAALETADDVVIVVTPDFPALKGVHAFFGYLAESNTTVPEPTIVLNDLYSLQTLSPADIEAALGRRVAIRIPYDPLVYLRAANQGTPVFSSAPTSQPARRFDQLAAILLGEDAPVSGLEPKRRRSFGSLFRS